MTRTARKRRPGPPGKGGGVPAGVPTDGQAMACLLGALGPTVPADGTGDVCMTQAEWESCPNPMRMAAWLMKRLDGPEPPSMHGSGPTGRRLRLFACAVARLAVAAGGGDPALAAVGAAERFCQEGTTPAEWTAAQDAADRAVGLTPIRPGARRAWPPEGCAPGLWVARSTLGGCLAAATEAARCAAVPALARAAALRDIHGTPFSGDASRQSRPEWRTPQAQGLAGAAEEDRPGGFLDPLRLGVLADCLEEAGASGPVLAHLRSPGPHFLGCWAVDAVLGRL